MHIHYSLFIIHCIRPGNSPSVVILQSLVANFTLNCLSLLQFHSLSSSPFTTSPLHHFTFPSTCPLDHLPPPQTRWPRWVNAISCSSLQKSMAVTAVYVPSITSGSTAIPHSDDALEFSKYSRIQPIKSLWNRNSLPLNVIKTSFGPPKQWADNMVTSLSHSLLPA